MKRRLSLSDYLIAALLLVIVAATIVPLLYALALSFSSNLASVRAGVHLWPSEWSTQGYETAWRRLDLARPFFNSVYVTVIGTFFHVMIAAMAAYTLLQRRFPARGLIVFLLFLTMSVPGEAIMVPLYIVNKQLGLLNTLTSLILSGLVSGFSILLLFNYFRGVPLSLVDAARIDGAGDFTIFSRVYLPISLPGLAAVSLFEIVGRWNQFTAPLLYITDPEKYTVQLALQRVVASNDSVSGADVVLPNTQMAAVVIAVGVLVLIFPFVQRFFVKGIVLGATKE
jgi:putative aldouronate transport system permease protein